MSDFFTVIVSNDEFVSLGISSPHDARLPTTRVAAAAHVAKFFFSIVIKIVFNMLAFST
jgi:hypothetical protein